MNCELVVQKRRGRTTDQLGPFIVLGVTVWDGGAQYTINFPKRKDFV